MISFVLCTYKNAIVGGGATAQSCLTASVSFVDAETIEVSSSGTICASARHVLPSLEKNPAVLIVLKCAFS